MATSFPALDRQVKKTLETLHDFLWMGKAMDETRLRADLTALGGRIESFLGKKSGFGRVVSSLAVKPIRDWKEGGTLYSVFSCFWHLTAATEHMTKRRYATAAAMAQEVVDGPMIGFASSLGHHEWVDAERSGKITHDEYLGCVADALEAKGAKRIGQLKRLATTVAEITEAVTTKSCPSPATAARASIQTAALFLSLYPETLRDLGWYSDTPHKDYARLAEFIASRA